jgi:WD40 repeat protein
VKVWEARTGQPRATLSGAAASVLCVAFSPNDEFVLGASSDNATRIWSIQQQRVRHALTGHIQKVCVFVVFAFTFLAMMKKKSNRSTGQQTGHRMTDR